MSFDCGKTKKKTHNDRKGSYFDIDTIVINLYLYDRKSIKRIR